MIVSAGIDQTTSSSRPEYSQSGQWNARVLDARKYQAKANIATMVGTTIASMIAIESIRIILSAAAIGPCGSRMFIGGGFPPPPCNATPTRSGLGDNARQIMACREFAKSHEFTLPVHDLASALEAFHMRGRPAA